MIVFNVMFNNVTSTPDIHRMYDGPTIYISFVVCSTIPVCFLAHLSGSKKAISVDFDDRIPSLVETEFHVFDTRHII